LAGRSRRGNSRGLLLENAVAEVVTGCANIGCPL
jgi:hypothetical protein